MYDGHWLMKALVVMSLLASASTALSAAALADPPVAPADAQARAVALYEESARAYKAGDFDEAARLVLDAYKLSPRAVLIYNLARAHEKGGHIEEAIREYQQYLADEPQASDRGYVEKTIVTLQRELETSVAAQEAQARGERAARYRREAAFITVGAGVAALGAGVALGIVASNHHGDAVNDRGANAAASDESTARSMATAANACFIGGGALAVGGLLWALLDRRAAEPGPRVHGLLLSPTLSGATILGRF
jgi:tetratricopeptide (TPR) repeat protein